MQDYLILLGALENVLGKSQKRARDNYAFHCPFCNHKKMKLEIKLGTDSEGKNPWECWVCRTRGRTVKSLLYQLKLPKEQAHEVLKFVHKGDTTFYTQNTSVALPEEFRSINDLSPTSIMGQKLRRYLSNRGISDLDILRYNIGFCDKGEYAGRIVIPSYDENNNLNFFVARTYEDNWMKYKNPEASKDIIAFENQINWSKPIVLVEGVFDAMAVRRNAIPILGKSLPQALLKKIVSAGSEDIYIALDGDAKKQALSYSEQLLNMGKTVYLVELKDKDPSEMGFTGFTNLIQKAQRLDLSLLLKYKMSL
jgi:DNA primase